MLWKFSSLFKQLKENLKINHFVLQKWYKLRGKKANKKVQLIKCVFLVYKYFPSQVIKKVIKKIISLEFLGLEASFLIQKYI